MYPGSSPRLSALATQARRLRKADPDQRESASIAAYQAIGDLVPQMRDWEGVIRGSPWKVSCALQGFYRWS